MSSGRGGTSRGRARGGGQRQERSRGGGRISTALPEVARLPDDVLEIMDQERSSRESIEDLVIDPETGNITALSFPSVPEPGRATRDLLDSPHGAPRFWGSPEWNSIPRFVILTGRNGAGKVSC